MIMDILRWIGEYRGRRMRFMFGVWMMIALFAVWFLLMLRESEPLVFGIFACCWYALSILGFGEIWYMEYKGWIK